VPVYFGLKRKRREIIFIPTVLVMLTRRVVNSSLTPKRNLHRRNSFVLDKGRTYFFVDSGTERYMLLTIKQRYLQMETKHAPDIRTRNTVRSFFNRWKRST